jgi:hypothetical protein
MKAPVLSSPEILADDKEVNQLAVHASPEISPDRNGAQLNELEQASSDGVPCVKSVEGHSDTAETTAKSSSCSDLSNIIKLSGSSDPSGCVNSDDLCVPFFNTSSTTVANESDIDFFRLGIVPENLVASLFDDDNAASGINAEQKQASEPRKGFVASDHPDATNWFYQDPQGVIQGNSDKIVTFKKTNY